MNLMLDSAFKATPILMAAWLATLVMRRASADLRHRVWMAAILTVAALPAALRIAPAALPASARIVVSSSAASVSAAYVPHFQWMLAVWIAGVAVVLARLGLGCFAASRLRPFSERVETPLTWGVLKPEIVLPSYMSAWTEPEREIVMRHEQAHIERHDWLWQTLARMVTAVFWFHPLMWLADAALRREAEQAADDRVLAQGTAAVDYAAQLLSVARRVQAQVPATAVAMVRRPELEGRVRGILDPGRNRSRAGIAAQIAIVLTAVAMLAPLTALSQDDSVHRIGERGLTGPRVVKKVEPQYTPDARDAKIEGTVTLQLTIDPDGKARNMVVTRSLDAGLDQSAMDAIGQWQFEPARKDGNAVRCAAAIEVNFHLK